MKSLFASKTFWVNLLAAIAAMVQALDGQPWFDPSIQAAILAVVNILLRLLTNQGVAVAEKRDKAVLGLALAFTMALSSAGCFSIYGEYDTAAIQEQQARHDAAMAYLQSSLDNVQASAEAAKLAHPENAAAIDAQVAPVISQLKSAVSSYKASLGTARASSTSEAWATARALLSTAVSVVGPMAINALVAR